MPDAMHNFIGAGSRPVRAAAHCRPSRREAVFDGVSLYSEKRYIFTIKCIAQTFEPPPKVGCEVVLNERNYVIQFEFHPTLTDTTLHLRPLSATDENTLTQAAHDPAIWAGHPAMDRYRPEVFKPYFEMLLASGGTLIVTDAKTNAVLGCSRYYTVDYAPEDIAIGFTFLVKSHWGGGTNFAMKKLMLDHAFQYVDCVWFDIAPTNIISQKATTKLGAQYSHDHFLDVGGGKREWKAYALARGDWVKRLETVCS
jgi:RimJ/RimL family protein N-acetyltransferase